jgi:hypothetical protein
MVEIAVEVHGCNRGGGIWLVQISVTSVANTCSDTCTDQCIIIRRKIGATVDSKQTRMSRFVVVKRVGATVRTLVPTLYSLTFLSSATSLLQSNFHHSFSVKSTSFASD